MSQHSSADAATVVTDHALIRWLERVHGIEVEALREVLYDRVRDAAAVGATRHRTAECTFIFRNGKLITVLDADMKPGRRHWDL